uniref:Beta-glucosidase n=1 Tax=Bionectria ochroleuca TaxID=29856 RepID=A0A0B7KRV1_BIOOC
MAFPIVERHDLKAVLPSNFLHGYASAAYQIEGATVKDGRGPCSWDDFLKDQPEKGDDACRSYDLWQEDVELLKQYGAKSYRFSISWSRIKPLGGKDDPINEKGMEYYNNLIDALIEAGVEPTVTLHHYDTPLALDEAYRGFASSDPAPLVADFLSYARLCFERFGDRVKRWLTINENYDWVEPLDESELAITAAKVAEERSLGWWALPIFKGIQTNSWDQYGEAFPKLTSKELELVKGSADFFSINHYGTMYATGKLFEPYTKTNFRDLDDVEKTHYKNGVAIGRRGENGHPHTVPWGFAKMLTHVWKTYAQPLDIPIYVYENGYPVEDESKFPIQDIVNDKYRQEFFDLYIGALCDVVKNEGAKIAGYHCWSLLDNLEWNFGYGPQFGLTYVDRKDGFKRIPKDSSKTVAAIWDHVVKK